MVVDEKSFLHCPTLSQKNTIFEEIFQFEGIEKIKLRIHPVFVTQLGMETEKFSYRP